MQAFSQLFYILSVLGQAFVNTWWIILPFALFFLFDILYTDYVFVRSSRSWIKSQRWTCLELIPPKDIERGPKVMESVFQGISGVTSTPNTFDKWIKGFFIQDRFSLEIFGEEGVAHFIVRIQTKYRNLFEAQIYAQYPDAEIREVEDYTQKFPRIIPNRDWDLYGTDFEFTAPAPYPVRTYDRFEEDITGTMIDPLAATMEVIGTLTPNQYIWMQYSAEPLHEIWGLEEAQRSVLNKLKKKEEPVKLTFLGHIWDVIANLWSGLFGPPAFVSPTTKEEQPLEFRLTPIEKEILKAVEDNLGKYMYRIKMRFIYLGRKENFDKSYVSAFIGSIKQFNDMNYNQFKPQDVSKTYGKIFFTKAIADHRKRKIYRRFRDRDFDGMTIVLSAKELATVYHFPDMGVKSPSVPRVASKLGTAPPNLPVR